MAQRGVNKVHLLGNLGADPEARYTRGGKAVTNIRIATSETWKDKQTGANQERTEWLRVVFFDRLAEIAGQYLTKGRKVYIEGRTQTRKWQDQSGADRYATEIIANELQILDSQGNKTDAYSEPDYGERQKQTAGGGGPDPEDDIPFVAVDPRCA